MSDALPLLKRLARALLTLAAVTAAALLVVSLWRAYVLAPWTRDGRVSAQVVRIAPEVSGTVVDVAVADNQYVKKGDVLYRIDPERFRVAVDDAEAALDAASETLAQKIEDAQRRKGMDDLVPREDIQQAQRAIALARAAQRRAQATLDLARLDLYRSELHAPTDGYITHLRLRNGDYAVAGQPALALLDAHSFWFTGYFEETKLRQVHPGAAARIRLMGYDAIVPGRVHSIGRGIADTNEQADATGLPSVEPSFSWIRLAQRIPVRIELGELPPGVTLVAGMTGSVDVGDTAGRDGSQGRLTTWLHEWM